MIRITRDPLFGYNVTAPGLPPVWSATRDMAAVTAWNLAERLNGIRAVSAQSMLAESLADLTRASRELTAAVGAARLAFAVPQFDAQLAEQLASG